MGIFSDFFNQMKGVGSQPSIMTQSWEDPYKTKVSGPLGDFLKDQIGKTIGEYPIDENFTNRYNEFLQYKPSEYFAKNIAEPTWQQFEKYARPVITEGYAGNLRGSGRYGAEEAGYVGLGEKLAQEAAKFVPEFAKSQLSAGEGMFKLRYANWYNSLAINNPAIKASIDFLNADSGYNMIGALNPGTQNWLTDLINAASRVGGNFWGKWFSWTGDSGSGEDSGGSVTNESGGQG